MPHIFISYAKKDTRKLALALADALNKIDGVTAWVDKSLRAGKSWELQIQTEIDRCDAMVVLYSPDINRHKQGKPQSYVLTEISYAKYTVNKLIIPVMAQQTVPPISLTMEHYIDFTIDGLGLQDLVEALCAELEIKPLLSDTIALSLSSAGVAKPTLDSTSSKPTSLSLMPKPFDWIEIPNKGYSIAKYPVTNAQFAKFIEAGGYSTERWWTKDGWQQKQSDNWTEPRYWQENLWNADDQPVIGVSWFETVAFCLWLKDVTGENIMLPTEDQWQYAAQGDDGRAYPWGNDWDCTHCNNSVKPCISNSTTLVTHYTGKGDSPFGVVDMVGNVWEWCLTDYDRKTDDFNSSATVRVLRGGCWFSSDADFLRCDDRHRDSPSDWFYTWGFRISRFN